MPIKVRRGDDLIDIADLFRTDVVQDMINASAASIVSAAVTAAIAAIDTNHVANALAGITFGAIGSHMLASTNASVAVGSMVAGSTLTPTGAASRLIGTGTLSGPLYTADVGAAQTGTWRCMGVASPNTSQIQTDGGDTVGSQSSQTVTLWMRVA
jgi:hypothetical protein